MKGIVMRSTGILYRILGSDKKIYTCTIRGRFRLEKITHSNPIEVGDHVVFEINEDRGIIIERLPRKNFIERRSARKDKLGNILAANVDHVLLIACLKNPYTPTGLIDRVLVTAESFRIPQSIVFNKSDLLSDKKKQQQQQLIDMYTALGIYTTYCSIVENINLTPIVKKLMGKITLVTGVSGVGKSSFLNRVIPGARQVVGEISNTPSRRGMHTTTYAEMFRCDETTFVIDTPGPKEWGMTTMTIYEISDYFPEMRRWRTSCKYGARCVHIHEPGCAVLAALEKGDIPASRYKSYISLVEEQRNNA